mgnify:CR=1 FL=1
MSYMIADRRSKTVNLKHIPFEECLTCISLYWYALINSIKYSKLFLIYYKKIIYYSISMLILNCMYITVNKMTIISIALKEKQQHLNIENTPTIC